MSRKSLKGEKAFVTGASRGIGKVVALRLAKEGCDLCLTARSAEALAEVAAECEKEGVKVVFVAADAKNTAELTAAIDKCVAELGGLTIVINNAGKLVMTRNDFSEWEDCIRTNLIPTMAVSKHAIQYLKANESSAIIQISSFAGCSPFKGFAPYSASKFGINGFSDTLFEEVQDFGIKVCTICPGLVDTNMTSTFGIDKAHLIAPEDIAESVVFVAKFPPNACPTRIILRPQKPFLRK